MPSRRLWAAVAVVCLLIAPAAAETGWASFYGNENGQWRRADGQRFNAAAVSCAHKTIQLGTMVRVTDLTSGRSIRCPVHDRGPYARGRIIDLSRGAAQALGIIRRGVARVKVERVR